MSEDDVESLVIQLDGSDFIITEPEVYCSLTRFNTVYSQLTKQLILDRLEHNVLSENRF